MPARTERGGEFSKYARTLAPVETPSAAASFNGNRSISAWSLSFGFMDAAKRVSQQPFLLKVAVSL